MSLISLKKIEAMDTHNIEDQAGRQKPNERNKNQSWEEVVEILRR